MLPEAAAFKKNWQKHQRALLESGVDCSYLYVHLEADTGKPFYVGMGETKTRPWGKKRSSKHKNRANKHGNRVELVSDSDLSWETALWWEVRWVKALKAAGFELANLTEGGDGAKGYKHRPEDIQKMSGIQQVRVNSDDYVPPMLLPGVREAHLEATQSEEFKAKQRARIDVEGNILDRPGAREAHLAAVTSDEFRETQRQRMLLDNPMMSDDARENYYAAISTPEYKAKKIESAPKGEDHYMAKNPEAGVVAGQRLVNYLTDELRSINGKKSWVTRRKNIAAKGPDYVPAPTEKQLLANKSNIKRCQESLTPEDRVANAHKGWAKRYKRYQYWGA